MKSNGFRRIWLILGLMILLLSAMYTTVLADTSEEAVSVPEVYYHLRNAKSNLYLDCEGYTNGSNVRQMYYQTWLEPQKFLMVHTEDDYYTIHPYESMEMTIDVNDASSSNTANIQVYQLNQTSAQKWRFFNNGNGTFRIASKCSDTNKVMVIQSASMESGANVFQYTYNASVNDQWYLEPEVMEGNYRIKNTVTGKYLRATGAGYVKLVDSDKGDNYQIFHITPSNNGYYDIAPYTNENLSISISGYSLDSDEENAYIITDYGQSHEGQRWRFILNPDGSYRMMSEMSGLTKAITVLSGDQTYVYSTTYATNNNANWVLEKVIENEDLSVDSAKDEYNLEGKHVIVDLDPATYFYKEVNGVKTEVYITPDNLNRWIEHLDAAYEEYWYLVGDVPQNGEKLRIIPVGGKFILMMD